MLTARVYAHAAGQPVEAKPLVGAPWPQLYQQQQLDGRPALQPVTHTLLLNLPEHRSKAGALMPAQDRQTRLIQVGAEEGMLAAAAVAIGSKHPAGTVSGSQLDSLPSF